MELSAKQKKKANTFMDDYLPIMHCGIVSQTEAPTRYARLPTHSALWNDLALLIIYIYLFIYFYLFIYIALPTTVLNTCLGQLRNRQPIPRHNIRFFFTHKIRNSTPPVWWKPGHGINNNPFLHSFTHSFIHSWWELVSTKRERIQNPPQEPKKKKKKKKKGP